MNLTEKIQLLQAAADGKTIQIRNLNGRKPSPLYPSYTDWETVPFADLDYAGAFNFSEYEYRVKPEPREIFGNIYSWGTATHETAKEARDSATGDVVRAAVKFREVIED